MSKEQTINQRLKQGCVELGLALSEEQIARLLDYMGQLETWNRTHNLTAVTDADQMVTHHLLDSVSIVPHLRGGRILDVGSGGGLPGIPIAIVRPDLQVILVECRHKRTVFLKHVVHRLGLKNVQVICQRVEAIQDVEGFSTITARAWTQLNAMIALTRHLLAPGGCLLAMKGERPSTELDQIDQAIEHELIELTVPGLDASRHLVRFEESQLD